MIRGHYWDNVINRDRTIEIEIYVQTKIDINLFVYVYIYIYIYVYTLRNYPCEAAHHIVGNEVG